jgi:hypothetical protein
MTGHTPTPWRVRDDVSPWANWISAENDQADLGEICEGWPSSLMLEAEANAARIVACVNACEGISNEALEAGAVSKAADTIEVLCEAFEAIKSCYPQNSNAHKIARAALAKATGVA